MFKVWFSMVYNIYMAKEKNEFNFDQYLSDQAAMLSRMKRFKEAAKQFRKDFGIPEKADPKNETVQLYVNVFTNAFYSFEVGAKGFSAYKDEVTNLLPQGKDILKGIENFALQFNLDSRWYSSLFLYLIMNEKEISPPLATQSDIRPRFNDVRLPDNEQVVTRLMIEIRRDTAIADIRKIWPKIKRYQKMMAGDPPQRRKLIDPATLKQYLLIRDMEDAGATQSEIADEIGFDAANDVSVFKAHEIERRFKDRRPPVS
jgi:hypothetical protein